MQRPPRPPNSPILSGFLLWRVSFVSTLLVAGAFGHFLWLEQQGAEHEFARTVAINTLVMGQLFFMLTSRSLLAPALSHASLVASRPALVAIGILIVLQSLFTYAPPLQLLFGTTAIGLEEWARILAFGLILFTLVELEKTLLRRRGFNPHQ